MFWKVVENARLLNLHYFLLIDVHTLMLLCHKCIAHSGGDGDV